MDLQQQLELLKRGAAGIVPEDGLAEKLRKSAATGEPLRVKLGIDPTAPVVHLGFAVVLRKLRQFQDLGHEVILIIGDFTAMIGDPSGRSETRKPLTADETRANAATYAEQYGRILDLSKTRVTFNSEWLAPLTFSEIIGLAGRVTVAQIMEREDFRNRFSGGHPIGLHELLYPLCQAYDSVHLRADIELGGTDQTFNILMGRELQREFGQDPQVALYTPILPGTDGVQKMSKSLGNTIGITEPPAEMFGKLMSLPDEVMREYFTLASDLPIPEIERLLVGHPMEAKKRLGEEVVRLYHGEEAGRDARAYFERTIGRGELPDDMPEVTVPATDLADGRLWIVALLKLAGMAGGTNEARRLVADGGVRLDGERVADPEAQVAIREGGVLQVGKRRFARLRLG